MDGVRTFGRLRAVLLALVLPTLASACVVDASEEEAVSTTVPLATTVPVVVTEAPSESSELETLMPDPLSGYEEIDDEMAGTGSVSVSAAALHEDRDDSVEFFTASGFEQGFSRRFEDTLSDRTIEIRVYEFDDPDAATAYLFRSGASAAESGEEFQVDEVPSSVAWVTGADDDSSAAATLLFTRGSRVARVDVAAESFDATTGDLSSMGEKVDLLVPPTAE